MSLELMYITNRPEIAEIAQASGVDRIFVDMEYIGKEARQPGDTVKSRHTLEDVRRIRRVLDRSELLVRVNPITPRSEDFMGSEQEINAAVEAGADILMLPMAKTVEEVRRFVRWVNGRTKTMLLLETAEAAQSIGQMLDLGGIDLVHIGLNDLHLAYGKQFMFELLTDGTVEKLCQIIGGYGIPYGFGGIARIGLGLLPTEYVLGEHYRLGSSAAILSRSFCNIHKMDDIGQIRMLFWEGVARIREFEALLCGATAAELESNRRKTTELVEKILEDMRGN